MIIYNGSNYQIGVLPYLSKYVHLWHRDYVENPLMVLSYGGGTQSTAMLYLVEEGKLPKPDIVIHADTGSEMPETVAFLETARELCEKMNIPFVIVTSHLGSLHNYYKSKKALPMIGVRSCTAKFKIRPQRRLVREIVGSKRGVKLSESWLGITTDEERRSLDSEGNRKLHSDVKYMDLSYPLLDIIPMSRKEVIEYNLTKGVNVPKSGCFLCPYAGSKHWHDLRANHPNLWNIVLDMENIKIQSDLEKGRKNGRGLFRTGLLSNLDNLEHKEDSKCDSGGCFL